MDLFDCQRELAEANEQVDGLRQQYRDVMGQLYNAERKVSLAFCDLDANS